MRLRCSVVLHKTPSYAPRTLNAWDAPGTRALLRRARRSGIRLLAWPHDLNSSLVTAHSRRRYSSISAFFASFYQSVKPPEIIRQPPLARPMLGTHSTGRSSLIAQYQSVEQPPSTWLECACQLDAPRTCNCVSRLTNRRHAEQRKKKKTLVMISNFKHCQFPWMNTAAAESHHIQRTRGAPVSPPSKFGRFRSCFCRQINNDLA